MDSSRNKISKFQLAILKVLLKVTNPQRVYTKFYTSPQLYRAFWHLSAHCFCFQTYSCSHQPSFQQQPPAFSCTKALVYTLCTTWPAKQQTDKVSDQPVNRVEHLAVTFIRSGEPWLQLNANVALCLLCVKKGKYSLTCSSFQLYMLNICQCCIYSLLHTAFTPKNILVFAEIALILTEEVFFNSL